MKTTRKKNQLDKTKEKKDNIGWKCFNRKQLEFFHSTFEHYSKDTNNRLTSKNFFKAFHRIGSIPSVEDQEAMCYEWRKSKQNAPIALQKEFYTEAEFFLILYYYFRYSSSEKEIQFTLLLFAEPDGTLTKAKASDVLLNLKHPLSKSTVTKILDTFPETQERISITELVKAIKPYSFL